MTQEMMNTPGDMQKFHPELWLNNAKPLSEKEKKALKSKLHLMYMGLVLANWAQPNTKLGTAKLKALEQMETFAKTLGHYKKNSAVAHEVTQMVAKLKKAVSEQIMKDKTSEIKLPQKFANGYKVMGEKLAQQNMQKLREYVKKDQTRVKTNEKQAKEFTPMNQVLLMQIMAQRVKAA